MLWHALLSLQPLEVAWLASNTEEGLEVVSVKVSSRLLSAVVAHEVDDKIVSSWDDDDSREGTSKVVWVIGNGLILSLLELSPKLVESVAVRSVFDSNVVDLFKAGDVERVGVAVVNVSIATTDRRVTLVVVVGV